MRQWLLWVVSNVSVRDVVFVPAIAFIGIGCGMESVSLGFIVTGSVLLGLLVLGRLRGG